MGFRSEKATAEVLGSAGLLVRIPAVSCRKRFQPVVGGRPNLESTTCGRW